MILMKRLALAAFLFLIPALAKADSVWTYQGNSIGSNPAGGEGFALTGTVLLNDSDQILGWNFSAGPDSFTNQNSTASIFDIFAGGSSQPFVFWDIMISLPFDGGPIHEGGFMQTIKTPTFALDHASDHDGSFQVDAADNPGKWTELISTPEPSSFLMLLTGVGLTLALCFAKS
jgi:hypothetical protein